MYSKRTNRFYVYAYLREDGTPYYIGKGSGWRMHQKHGYLHLPPDRSRRVKIRENLTDEESQEYEKELISKYGRKGFDEGGILRNITMGGDSGRVKYHTVEEAKQAVRDKNPKYQKTYREKHGEEYVRKLQRESKRRTYHIHKEKLHEKSRKEWIELKKDPEKKEEYYSKCRENYHRDKNIPGTSAWKKSNRKNLTEEEYKKEKEKCKSGRLRREKDPEYRERRLAELREYGNKKRKDPEWNIKQLERQRIWREKNKEEINKKQREKYNSDPKAREEKNRKAREKYNSDPKVREERNRKARERYAEKKKGLT